jgi:hypothetical protein
MPLSDFFKFGKDPLVQSGVISRPENWQMRLGSLAAAFGDYDRQGMLGPTLARAGAIYQGERQRTLASAFERMQEEAKARREEELYRMRLEEHYAKQDEEQRRIEAEQVKVEQEVQSREARRRWLDEHSLPMYLADEPEAYKLAQRQWEDANKPKEEKARTFQSGGTVMELLPDGTKRYHQFPGGAGGGGKGEPDPEWVENLVQQFPQHEAAIRLNPQVAASQYLQQQFDTPSGGGKTSADPRRKALEEAAMDLLESDWADQFVEQNGRPPDIADAANEAARRQQVMDSIFGPQPKASGASMLNGQWQYDSKAGKELAKDLRGGTKPVKAQGGEPVAGMHMPDPKKSSLGNAKMGLVKASPKKTQQEAEALVRLQSLAEQFKRNLPPELAPEFEAEIQKKLAAGEDPEAIAREIEVEFSLSRVRR